MGKKLIRSTNEKDALLSAHEIVPQLRNPFIRCGYRSPTLSPSQCLVSLFTLNNETFNIWSHFAPFIWLTFTYCKYFSEHSVFDSKMWPILSFACVSQFTFLMSFVAHTFCALSPKKLGLRGWRVTEISDLLFLLDFTGINNLLVGSSQGYLFYTSASNSILITYHGYFLLVSLLMSNIATYIASTSHLKTIQRNSAFAQTFFILPYLLSISPLIYKLQQEEFGTMDEWSYLLWQFFFGVLGFSLHALKIPERLAPGKFDYVGSSHNWMHACSVVGIFQTRNFFVQKLSSGNNVQTHMITIWNTLALTLACFTSNILIVIIVFLSNR